MVSNVSQFYFSIDSKLKNVIQNTKPRVDTHWKKAPGATVKSTSTAAEHPKKILTRSNSTRAASISVESSASQRNGVAGLNKHKTLTTKVVEHKLQQAKRKHYIYIYI